MPQVVGLKLDLLEALGCRVRQLPLLLQSGCSCTSIGLLCFTSPATQHGFQVVNASTLVQQKHMPASTAPDCMHA